MLFYSTMKYITILLLSFCICIPALASQDLMEATQKEQAKEYRQKGYELQAKGDLEGALSSYQKAQEFDPLYVESYNDIGVIYENLGKYDNAIEMYKKSVEIDPTYLPAYTNLALLYENRGDIKNASYFWGKRYELGEEGEYWWEVSRQHLMQLGTYPDFKKDFLETEAMKLSKEIAYQREQTKLKGIEEAKLHFDVGSSLFMKGDYQGALKELELAQGLNPDNKELADKIKEFYLKTKRSYARDCAIADIQAALSYIQKDDFLSAGEELKNALSSVFRISQEK